MSSIIIKLTSNGSSQEYLFNKLGPIIIGSDENCDLVLEDAKIGPKLLEVKVSGGNIFIKEIGARGEIYLDSVILPFRQETRYFEGSCISLKDTHYQIHISKVEVESAEPPPFFDTEFKERLERMSLRIQEKERELRTLDQSEEKRKHQIQDLEDKYHRHVTERNKLEIEVNGLRTHKEQLSQEIKKSLDKSQDEEEKIIQLRDFVKNLENEERHLKDTIVAQNLVLTNLKDEREKKSKEVDSQRKVLSDLKLDATKLEEQIHNLEAEYVNQQEEIQHENVKIQKILASSEDALKEGAKVQRDLALRLKEKSILEHDISELQESLEHLEIQRKDAQVKIEGIKFELEEAEANHRRIQDEIRRESEEEKNLKVLNMEIRADLVKIEEKLSLKKNQLNQADFDRQDATRKLSTITFELERSSLRLKELQSEERAHELRMASIREDVQNLVRRSNEEKKEIIQSVEEEKEKSEIVFAQLRNREKEQERVNRDLEAKEESLKLNLSDCESKLKQLSREKIDIETHIGQLKTKQAELVLHVENAKTDVTNLEHERSRTQRELNQLQLKLADCESLISERQQEAVLEMENFKRDERAKIAAEKEVSLAEVEAFRQKSLIEVEAEYRRKQNDLHQTANLANEEANKILAEARKTEVAITQEAQNRLKEATEEALKRESTSHERVKEAQEFFKAKEKEAQNILDKARIEAKNLVRQTEVDLQEDLNKRKGKIKKFLTMRQEKGLAHIEALTLQHQQKLKKEKDRKQASLEDARRRELKKIAKLKEDEVSRQHELKNTVLKEVEQERLRLLAEVKELKKIQEDELAQKKKSMLEHINTTKFSQQKAWEEELRREREAFNRTKRERIGNAAQAVMNILISEMGPQGENEDRLKNRVLETLQMAIDGQNAGAIKEVEQVLDFNPVKRKKVMQVIQKYTVRVGIPAAIAITILADVGSVRTVAVDKVKDLLKQRESASEIYVTQQKTEWKEKNTYNPETTVGYKPSLVENVVYTTDFMKVMDNEDFQNDWILKVHDFMTKDLELSEDVAINYISSEGTAVKEIATARNDLHPQFLDQGMKKLTDLEQTHLGWLKEKITDPTKMDKFLTFRKEYYDKFYEDKFAGERNLASEPVQPVTNP